MAPRDNWRAALRGPPRRVDVALVLLLALAARGIVVLWAASRFPAAEDGRFYHVVAGRIAEGAGYTWAWPDGTVTFAAHYPVGYPAMIGGLYSIFGQHPSVAMIFNAVLGSLAVVAVHRIAATVASRMGAGLAALLAALHPTLVGYTPALMTEGVVGGMLALVAWMALATPARPGSACRAGLVATALLLGLAALVRPQVLLLAPLFGAVAVWSHARGTRSTARWRVGLVGAVVTTALVVLTCLPWTLRNCSRMGRCVFVSANGGWNLLIGAGPGATGSWVPVQVAGIPAECREVFDEAQKDVCFAAGAIRSIRSDPLRWLGLVPAKLGHTFDASGAPGYYLHRSNPGEFGQPARDVLAAAETVWQRSIVGLSLLALALVPGPRRRVRMALAGLSALWLLQRAAWPGYVGLVLAAALLGRQLARHPPALLAAGAVAMTALTHAVFFGASRYAMVCYPLLAALGGSVLRPRAGPANRFRSGPIAGPEIGIQDAEESGAFGRQLSSTLTGCGAPGDTADPRRPRACR